MRSMFLIAEVLYKITTSFPVVGRTAAGLVLRAGNRKADKV